MKLSSIKNTNPSSVKERLTDYIKKLEKRIIELENKENQK